MDVVVSSVGRDLFGRMVDLLVPGGRLVFYGATSGYTLAFLGKAGAAAPARRCSGAPTCGPTRACSSTGDWRMAATTMPGARR